MNSNELLEYSERMLRGEATREDIEIFVDEFGRPNLYAYTEGPQEKRDWQRICNYAQQSQPYYVTLLIDYLKNTPSEAWGYFSACEFLGLVLKRHPAELNQIAPLLQDDKLRLDAVMILGMSETPEALPLIETLFDHHATLDDETVVELVDSLLCLNSENAFSAIDHLRLLLSERIASSPQIQAIFEEASHRNLHSDK